METSKRLMALDVFRGLTVFFMIIVNNPGNPEFTYAPLMHSKWNGCTPTDLVFPFFMFIVGAAMWYSYKKYNYKLTGNVVFKILRRSFFIYLAGFLITWYSTLSFDLSGIRIMGVLPRIAIAYCIASFIVLRLRKNWVIITTLLILLGYWAILLIFGGNSPFSLENNFARTFDIAVLGKHVHEFHGVQFDQTGLLSTLPSIANILLGFLAGKLIDTTEIKMNAVKRLIIYGVAGIALGIAWSFLFPINKPLWTSSFVMYTCGFASLFLGIFLWIIDIKGYKKWTTPFQVFGMNPLFIYVFSEFLAITLWIGIIKTPLGESVSTAGWLYNSVLSPLVGKFIGSLLFALMFTFICWLIGWVLYRKKIFIKL
jgi:predicted acyltransferase